MSARRFAVLARGSDGVVRGLEWPGMSETHVRAELEAAGLDVVAVRAIDERPLLRLVASQGEVRDV